LNQGHIYTSLVEHLLKGYLEPNLGLSHWLLVAYIFVLIKVLFYKTKTFRCN